MPFIGFAETDRGPAETYDLVLRELEGRGFGVTFSKHHWAGDMPFGLILAESERGKIAVRWRLGRGFNLRLEEVEDEVYEDFVEETLDYLSGD